ncbi:MAG: GNAT family N-acetyltransferase [Alphaproteobacteria bacterium]|nr:GNAT family N-acetyltransferase [Alphaproteobacteria bacterium]
MLQGLATMPNGLSIRPARPADKPFLEKLHRDQREDLKMVDADRAYIEELLDMQLRAQTSGYGGAFPNALYFVIEKTGDLIGKLTLDWGGTEARVIDLGFVKKARGKGFGQSVIMALLAACGPSKCPLAVSVAINNPPLYQWLLAHGFVVADAPDGGSHHMLIWYPGGDAMAGQPGAMTQASK